MKTKPFDIELAKQGRGVVTSVGTTVKILGFNGPEEYPVVTLVWYGGNPHIHLFSETGEVYDDNLPDSLPDIKRILTLKMSPIKHTKYMCVWRNTNSGHHYAGNDFYDTYDEAYAVGQKDGNINYFVNVGTITWEE